MSDFYDDRACDWCGEFEDTAGPLEGVLCGDGTTMWLCGACIEGNDD